MENKVTFAEYNPVWDSLKNEIHALREICQAHNISQYSVGRISDDGSNAIFKIRPPYAKVDVCAYTASSKGADDAVSALLATNPMHTVYELKLDHKPVFSCIDLFRGKFNRKFNALLNDIANKESLNYVQVRRNCNR